MSDTNKTTNEESKEQSTKATQTLYEAMGGEVGVRDMVDRFYDLMDLEEEFKVLRALHPADLSGSRDKLFMFFSGWMGGPDLYMEKFGHPRLRARHLPFSIGAQERDEWVTCMGRAMKDVGVPDDLFERLLESFYGTADWMRNRAD
jgi:hemoglobin